MSLDELMVADLEHGLAIVRESHQIVPAWRIPAPERTYLILTCFDPERPEQRERMLTLVPRFMAWKLARVVLTAETWLGSQRPRSGEEAVLTIGVSRHERLGVIRRTPAAAFAPPEWLGRNTGSPRELKRKSRSSPVSPYSLGLTA
jgi:hypothetical protein